MDLATLCGNLNTMHMGPYCDYISMFSYNAPLQDYQLPPLYKFLNLACVTYVLHVPDFLKLLLVYTSVYVCVFVCVRPFGINKQYCDMV